jgi:hypothetical protein
MKEETIFNKYKLKIMLVQQIGLISGLLSGFFIRKLCDKTVFLSLKYILSCSLLLLIFQILYYLNKYMLFQK